MKYIIVKSAYVTLEQCIVFDEILDHDSISDYHPDNIVAAGFVQFYNDPENGLQVSCYGKSTTLKKQSRGNQDADIILRNMIKNRY